MEFLILHCIKHLCCVIVLHGYQCSLWVINTMLGMSQLDLQYAHCSHKHLFMFTRAMAGDKTISENYAFAGMHHIFDQHKAAGTFIWY